MTVQTASVSLLEVHALTFLRHDLPVFAPQSFSLCAGELVWVEGANGSGKTIVAVGGKFGRPGRPDACPHPCGKLPAGRCDAAGLADEV